MSSRTLSSVSSCKPTDRNYVVIKPYNEYIYCTYRHYKKNYTCKIFRIISSKADAESLTYYLNNVTILDKLSINDLFLDPNDEKETIYRVTAISIDNSAKTEIKNYCTVITGKVLFIDKRPCLESITKKFRYTPVFKLDKEYIQQMLSYYSFLAKEVQKGV